MLTYGQKKLVGPADFAQKLTKRAIMTKYIFFDWSHTSNEIRPDVKVLK